MPSNKPVLNNCPVRKICQTVGDFWTLLIIHELKTGGLRFNELQDRTNCASTSTLTRKLKALVAGEIVSRHEFHELPPKVEYKLTDKGRKIADLVDQFAGV